MKKHFFTIIILVSIFLLFPSCNEDAKTDVTNAASHRDSLNKVIADKQDVINNLETFIKDIESSLDSISGQQKNITQRISSTEKIKSFSDFINKDIIIINSIIKSNRSKISELNRKLSAEKEKNKNLEEKIIKLNWELSEKQYELLTLKENLDDYNTGFMALETAFDYLALDNEVLAETVLDETDQLHTAYYISGTLKQLQKDSILDKKGGLLGFGKTPVLKNEFSRKKFKQIDYSKSATIPVYAKKIKILTTHSSKSYRIDKDKEKIKSLTIIDPVTFWKLRNTL